MTFFAENFFWISTGVIGVVLTVAVLFVREQGRQAVLLGLGSASIAASLVMFSLFLQERNDEREALISAQREAQLSLIEIRQLIEDTEEETRVYSRIKSGCFGRAEVAEQVQLLIPYVYRPSRDFSSIVRDHSGALARKAPAAAAVMRFVAVTHVTYRNTLRLSFESLVHPFVRVENQRLFDPSRSESRTSYVCDAVAALLYLHEIAREALLTTSYLLCGWSKGDFGPEKEAPFEPLRDLLLQGSGDVLSFLKTMRLAGESYASDTGCGAGGRVSG